MSNLKLEFVITAIDDATKKLRAVNQAIDKGREPMLKVRALSREMFREAGWDKMRAGFNQVQERAGSLWGTLKSVTRGLGLVTLAAGGMFAIFKRSADEVDRINDAAQKLGIGTQRFQELGFAAQMSGASADEMAQALEFLAQNMDEARNGSQEATLWFARAGITLKDLRNPAFKAADAFERLSDKYAQVGDAGQNSDKKIAMSRALMGKAGARMNQLLNQGSPALRKFADEARRVGYVLTEDTVGSMTAFNDEFDRAKLTLFGNLANAFGRIAPKMSELVTRFTDYVVANRELIATGVEKFFLRLMDALPQIVSATGALANGVMAVVGWADRAATAMGGWDKVMRLLALFIGAVLIGKTLALGVAVFQLGQAVIGFTTLLAPLGIGLASVLWPVAAVMALVGAIALLVVYWDEAIAKVKQLDAAMPDWLKFGGMGNTPLIGANWWKNGGAPDAAGPGARPGSTQAPSALPAGGSPVRPELGGTLKIEIDSEGRPRVRELVKKAGSLLDFDVYAGPAMRLN